MSNSKQKIKLTLWLSGIILFGATLYVSGFAFAKPAQAGFLDDWLCQLFGECGGGQQVPQPGPAPAQPQPQPEPSSQPVDEASDESSGRGGEDYAIVPRSICEGEGRVENDWGFGEVGCVFPYKAPTVCNFNGDCERNRGETLDNCFSDCRPKRQDIKPAPGVAQLGDVACGCTSRGFVWSCSGYAFYPNACNTATRCSEDVDNRCAPAIPFAGSADGAGSGGQGGQGGSGGQGSSEGIFGPGGLFGPGSGGAGGAGGGGGAGSTQCSDRIDNDNDGKIDAADSGCLNPLYDPNDNSELKYRIKEVIPDFFNLNWFKFDFA